MNESTIDISYASAELQRQLAAMVADMHPELLKKAIKRAYNIAGGKLRTQARNMFAAEVPGLGHRADRAIDYKMHRNMEGFSVRVRYSGAAAMLTNRRGLEKPLPLFLNMSTDMAKNPHGRMTKPGNRRRAAHYTGVIRGAEIMQKVEAAVPQNQIDEIFKEALTKASERILKKYGNG